MKLKVLTLIFGWLDQGYTTSEIAVWTCINPEIIDSINELRKVNVDWELFA